MTFWAIDKIKNIRNIGIPQNVKNIGSKLASLVVSREPVQQSHPATSQEEMLFCNDKESFAKVPPMELQSQQYDRLCEIQSRILRRVAAEQQRRLQQQKDQLQRQLQQLIEQTEKQQVQRQKQQIYEKLQSGQLQLKRLLQQNLLLKELIHESAKQ